jgi:rhodanese-related sulfurtransferase
LNRSFEDIRKFKDKEIICYCRSGNRSLSAAILLQKKGINAANLIGGITAWKFQKQK